MRIIETIKSRPAVQRFIIFLSVIGPGIITANVDNDAGGITTYSLAGANFKYAILWTLVPIMVALIIVQEMCNRMGVITGKGLSDLIREKFGVKITFYLMILILMTNFGNIISEFAGIAASLELFGISKYISVPAGACIVWYLVVKGTYKSVEKVFLFACVFYISYIVSGVQVQSPWGEITRSIIFPELSFKYEYLLCCVGVIGTTIAPWMQFYQQASVAEKGIKADNYHYSRIDTIVGCIVVNVIAFFIIVVCGTVLYTGQGAQPIQTAADAARALRPLAGKYSSFLFAFGLLNASLFAASILPLSTAYTVCESFGWETGVDKNFNEAPQFYILYTLLIFIGAGVILFPDTPLITIMMVSQVINGLVLPFILVFMLIIINDRKIMREYTNSRLANVLTIIFTIAISILSITLAVASFL